MRIPSFVSIVAGIVSALCLTAGTNAQSAGVNESANGDVDGDRRVTLLDFAYWSQCMTGPVGGVSLDLCRPFDYAPLGAIDLSDAAAFQRTFGRLLNDDCRDAAFVAERFTDFTTVDATTDGNDEPNACDFYGYTQIESDIWFRYEATCSGQAVFSLCGSEYDTKLAVYEGYGCPTASPLACSDDDCSAGTVDSRVTLPVTTGKPYLIRVGGVPGALGAQGSGTLTISCGVEPCHTMAGSCAFSNGTPGCDWPDCCRAVCDVDAFCCDVTWDDFCAAYAAGVCLSNFPACNPTAGDCWAANDTPGCDSETCCVDVCTQDPFCCVDEWDVLCVEAASDFCLQPALP